MPLLDGFSGSALFSLGLLVFFAGFVDALAGGGGLITLPAYLLAGLNPALLLGTNKMSSSLGTLAAVYRYFTRLRYDLKPFIPLLFASVAGSAAGARLALLIDPSAFRYILIIVIPVSAYLVFSRHSFHLADLSSGLQRSALARRSLLISFFISCYDGFIGPGTGTFLALAFTRFCRYDLLKSTAYAKLLNLSSNAAALATFLWAGKVNVPLGIIMGAASIAGNYAGSHVGIRKGTGFIRFMLLAVCSGLMLRLVWDMFR